MRNIFKRKSRAEKFAASGEKYFAGKQYKESASAFTRALEAGFNHAAVYYRRGRANALAGRRGKAITDFTRVISLQPDNAHAYHNRGRTYREKKEYRKAADDFTKAVELEPHNASFYNSRGFTLARLGEYDRAINDLTKAIELDRRYARAYYNRGVVHRMKGEYAKAIADHERYTALSPERKKSGERLIDIAIKDRSRGAGENSACPYCAEIINPEAMRCRFCGMNLLEFSKGKKTRKE